MSAPALPSARAQATHQRGLRASRGLPFILLYLPLLVLFGLGPMVYALVLAFTNSSGGFVGFQNFIKTATDFRFVSALEHVLVYTAIWLVMLLVFVVALALLLHGRANKVTSSFRFLFTSPERSPAPRPSWSGFSCSTLR